MNSRCFRVQRTLLFAAWRSFDRLIMPTAELDELEAELVAPLACSSDPWPISFLRLLVVAVIADVLTGSMFARRVVRVYWIEWRE